MERLQKVIASCGYCSRRKAEKLIVEGKVQVNGKVIKELGTKVSYNDTILVEGNLIVKKEKQYYLFNKPRGVICSTKDEKGRKIILDYFDDKSLYPVGRLDYNTTGIILLTNDGEFANAMMSPKNKILKYYIAKLNKIITVSDILKIKKGIIIDGVKCVPDKIKLKKINKETNTCIVEIVIHDGRNHEVKKIFEKVGYDVLKLKREMYGMLDLTGVKSGEYRKITKKEINKLYEIIKNSSK